jgi:hypothetical protein
MKYDRNGIYTPKNINKKKINEKEKKSFDYLSLMLFILLIILVILFITT